MPRIDLKSKIEQDMLRELDNLYSTVLTANENGLLRDRSDFDRIMSTISDARWMLSRDESENAFQRLSGAHHMFNTHLYETTFVWRFVNFYGGYILIYLIAAMTSILTTWFLFPDVLFDLEILWIPSWAFLWGAMGGVLQGFWLLWKFVIHRKMKKTWFVYAFSLPLMGSILGALAYLIFFSGFMAVTGDIQTDSQFFIMLICALAGFSSQWAVNLLNSVTEMIQIGSSKEQIT